MQRSPSSHKGDNGSVAIIGGSRTMHGAPLLTALGAEKTGCDLLYLCVPHCHEEVSKVTSLNFQVHPFDRDHIEEGDIEPILELLATMDSAVIGPGISHAHSSSITALHTLIEAAMCPLVLDATALDEHTVHLIQGKDTILTPHQGELERMNIDPERIGETAEAIGATILLKGGTDTIYDSTGNGEIIEGGNAGLTVGGTGDVLAGVIAGLRAQGLTSKEAAISGSKILKRSGERLFEKKMYAYEARDVIEIIPEILKEISVFE